MKELKELFLGYTEGVPNMVILSCILFFGSLFGGAIIYAILMSIIG